MLPPITVRPSCFGLWRGAGSGTAPASSAVRGAVAMRVEQDMNDRTCIVTRESGYADDMIRFVAGPDGAVVPDLKHELPGRG